MQSFDQSFRGVAAAHARLHEMSHSALSCEYSSDEASDSEAWLDEMCLEPLVSEIGYSTLCNACKRVFWVLPGEKGAKHIQYLDTLVRSAQRGCVLCSLVKYQIDDMDPSHHLLPQIEIRYEMSFPVGDNERFGVRLVSNYNILELLMLPLGDFPDFSSSITIY